MNDLIGLIGSGITMTKGLLELSRDFNNVALVKQISDLTIQLAQVQTEAAQMMSELQTLKAEAEEQENNPLRYTGAIYRDMENIPYCPACYDDRKKRIHLSKYPILIHSFFCPVCKTDFETGD